MYQHILIPTDGSEVASKGVAAALALAKTLGARATLLIVTEPLPAFADPVGASAMALNMADYSKAQNEHAATVLKSVKADADKAGVPAETLHVPDSQPSDAILAQSQARGCDLIAMASHGRRGLGRLFLGSQTADVVTRSPIPVLVLK